MKFIFGDKPTVWFDFDGTIVEEDFPFIGRLKPYALKLFKELKAAGWNILIFTCRTGKYEEDVRNFLQSYNIEVDTVNKNLPGYEKYGFEDSRKLGADVIVDDRSVFFEDNLRLVLDKLLQIYDQRRENNEENNT